ITKPVKVYRCRSDPTIGNGLSGAGGWATTSYAYNYQIFVTDWDPHKFYPAGITDGTSLTIFFTEKYSQPSKDPWSIDWGGNTWWEWAPKFAFDITGTGQQGSSNEGVYNPSETVNYAYRPLMTPSQQWCDSNQAYTYAS